LRALNNLSSPPKGLFDKAIVAASTLFGKWSRIYEAPVNIAKLSRRNNAKTYNSPVIEKR
jgi:hypothetical protein